MKKNQLMLAAFFLTAGILISSCGNLTGGNERNSLHDICIIRTHKGGTLRTPSEEKICMKVSESFALDFDTDAEWEFIRWRAFDDATKNELPDGECLSFSAPDSPDSVCTLRRAPEDGIILCIEPVLCERPKVISYEPLYADDGSVSSDFSIRVSFDRDMDSESIYFTDSEMTSLLESGVGEEDFLYADVNGERKCYGYVSSASEYVFKNVSISDREKETNLNVHFNAPYFEDSRTLIITQKTGGGIPAGTQVLVKLEKGFSYKAFGKNVCMSSEMKWIFKVSDD